MRPPHCSDNEKEEKGRREEGERERRKPGSKQEERSMERSEGEEKLG